MSSSFWRLAASSRGTAPLAAAAAVFLPAASQRRPQQQQQEQSSRCEAAATAAPQPREHDEAAGTVGREKTPPSKTFQEGMQSDAQGSFHGLFPRRQLFVPALEYPLWNKNWDGRQMASTGDDEEDRRQLRQLRKTGVTRHIILVRHGQYDESSKDDEKRILTPLGREQAHLTGQRIAEMMEGLNGAGGGPANCKITLRVSGLRRAIETADLIATHLPGVEVEEHDPLLNEGR